MKKAILVLLATCLVSAGCALFHSWKAIPPPGGCDQCHTAPISADWKVAYQPATINDETGKYSWQKSTSMLPPQEAPMDQQKVTEERCFRCHKGPNAAHIERAGRYHH